MSYTPAFRLLNFIGIACYAHLLSTQGHSLFASVAAAVAVTAVATTAFPSARVSA